MAYQLKFPASVAAPWLFSDSALLSPSIQFYLPCLPKFSPAIGPLLGSFHFHFSALTPLHGVPRGSSQIESPLTGLLEDCFLESSPQHTRKEQLLVSEGF